MFKSNMVKRLCCLCHQWYRSLQPERSLNSSARQYYQRSILQPYRVFPLQSSSQKFPFVHQRLIPAASVHNAAFREQQLVFSQKQSYFQERSCILPVAQSVTHFQQVRTESTDLDTSPPPSDLIYIPTPVEVTYEFLEYFHDEVCLSWWMAIVATTVIYKSLLSFPLAVLQQRVFARIENVQPQINTFVEQAKQQLALIAKERNWSKAEHQNQFDREVKGIVRSIHTRQRCGPIRLSYVFLAQAGIWVSVTTALGQMTGWYPELFSAEPDIDVLTSLSTGGILWFADLMQSDIILPVCVGLVNLTLVELWSLRKGPLTRMQDRFHNVARVLAIGSMPLAASMPSAISFYWLVSSLFSLAQFALLRNLWVRRAAGIPKSPSEMKHPLKEMKTALKIKYQGKKVF